MDLKDAIYECITDLFLRIIIFYCEHGSVKRAWFIVPMDNFLTKLHKWLYGKSVWDYPY